MKEGIRDHAMKHSIGCAPRRGIEKEDMLPIKRT